MEIYCGHAGIRSICTFWTRGMRPAGCLKNPFSKAAGESKPEAYPLGYFEDFDKSRTKLAGFFSILLGLVGGGQSLVDFPDEAPFNFRDLFRAHAEDASTLGQFFEVSLDAEPGDIRRERVKRQHELIP